MKSKAEKRLGFRWLTLLSQNEDLHNCLIFCKMTVHVKMVYDVCDQVTN